MGHSAKINLCCADVLRLQYISGNQRFGTDTDVGSCADCDPKVSIRATRRQLWLITLLPSLIARRWLPPQSVSDGRRLTVNVVVGSCLWFSCVHIALSVSDSMLHSC